MGYNFPYMRTTKQLKTEEYFVYHPVFSLEEAVQTLAPAGGYATMVERLKYHVARGRLKHMARGLYAAVPPGQSAEQFQPDAFLVAAVLRPDAVFCYHSALELLGAAHSIWHEYTVFSIRRRPPFLLNNDRIVFLEPPTLLQRKKAYHLGTRQVERSGRLLRVTSPERTLIEGFRRLDLVGGISELVESAAGFPYLDLDLVFTILEHYHLSVLWAASGWFLETHQAIFQVSDDFLKRLESQRPKGPLYLGKRKPGGMLASRWNLILPFDAARLSESHEH